MWQGILTFSITCGHGLTSFVDLESPRRRDGDGYHVWSLGSSATRQELVLSRTKSAVKITRYMQRKLRMTLVHEHRCSCNHHW